jgi:hypothetical protein
VSINSDASANTLRAKDSAATTLTIADGQTLALGLNFGSGILLTPDAGKVDIEGGALDVGVNSWLHIHNYSTNRLTIGSLIELNFVNSDVMTCGPGEVRLANETNTFTDLGVHGGTLLFDQIANSGEAQQLGTADVALGDATLKYTGSGHSSDRTIALRGAGVIDASGTGPLTFTATGDFITQPGGSLDMPLTLAGTGTGSIAGTSAMTAGYLTKTGSGMWTLGNGWTNWSTEVQDGTLCVNGTLFSWYLVEVEPDGRLAGTGAIPRDLEISGTVAPGLSPGTLAAGFVTFNPGAVYEWEVGSPGTSDLISASGDIEIGTVENSITVMVSKLTGTSQSGSYTLFSGDTIIGASNAVLMSYSSGIIGAEHPVIEGGEATVSLIPEPAAAFAGVCAVCLALRRRA